MEEEEDFNIFIKYFPIFTHKKKAILIFLYHSVIFLSVFSILLYIRFNYCLAAIPAQFLITCGENVPLIYILINFDKLREK